MTEKLKIPNQVVDSDWKDDIGDFETYEKEGEYVSPSQISRESIKRIKARNEKIGHNVLNIFKNNKLAVQLHHLLIIVFQKGAPIRK